MRVMMSMGEVADGLGVSVSTIRRLIRGGKLKAVRVGRQVRVEVDWVGEMLNINTIKLNHNNRSESNECV